MIFFDNASTTKVSENVLNDFLVKTKEFFANPSSIHHLGMDLANRILREKVMVLTALKLQPRDYEVVYTSSATEANNLAIMGYCLENSNRGKHIITTKVEHASVMNVFKELEKNYGFRVTYLSMKENGTIDIDELKSVINKETILVSTMAVNNETGAIFNIKEVSDVVAKFPKCVLHCDCAQTLGKALFQFNLADMITITSHKIHGLKSIACLIKKKKINLRPILFGGGQQDGLRSSTMDYPLISSFTVAIKETVANYSKNLAKVREVFNTCVEGLKDNPHVKLHLFEKQSPYILNLSLTDKKASVVVEALSNKGIFVSSVSACSSKEDKPSYVLLAFNKPLEEAKNTIRLSFDSLNTVEEANIFLKEFNEILESVRS